jgi:hypothetical protein
MRPAPAYQEYASDVLAREEYKEMSAAERGLWHSMRLQCWVNRSVPNDPVKLAALLHLDPEDVKRAYTPNVLSFFSREGKDGHRLVCAELEDYRADQEAKREQKQFAGRAGAAARHRHLRPGVGSDLSGMPDDVEEMKKLFGDHKPEVGAGT